MTAPTAEEYKAFLLAEIKDQDGSVAAQWGILWYRGGRDVALDTPRLTGDDALEHQYRKAKIHAIELLMGQVRLLVTQQSASGAKLLLEQLMQNLGTLRENTLEEIARIERRYHNTGGSLSGQLTTVAPLTSPGRAADANAQVYRGDPNAPVPRRGW